MEKQKMSTARKWLWGIGIFLGLYLLSRIFNPQDPGEQTTGPTPTAEASTTVSRTPSAPPHTRPPPAPAPTVATPAMPIEPPQIWADRIDADARAQFGVDAWQETCQSPGAGWSCLVDDMTATKRGQLILALQVSYIDPNGTDISQSAARALFNLLQTEHPELTEIKVVDPAGDELTTVGRSQALPLEGG